MTLVNAIAFGCAFLVSLGALLGFSRLAPRLGLVDHPTGRKAHSKPTPVVGGLAITAGAVVASAAALTLSHRPEAMLAVLARHPGFLIGAIILLGLGLLDDRRPVSARNKLLVQLFCCVLAVYLDNNIVGDVGFFVGPYMIAIGPLVAPFSVLVMLTVTNAINMIDGVDGLAAGIIFVAFAVMTKALVAARFTSAPYLISALGALAAFLALNFPLFPRQRAHVFLGDAGTLILGFALGYIAIELSALPGRVVKPSTALWLFFIPVCDTVWLYMRRLVFARAPFAAGRDHIHHLLMDRFSPRMTTWILVSASAVLAGGAYIAERRGVDNSVLILGWIVGFTLYGLLTQKAWRRAWNISKAQIDTA